MIVVFIEYNKGDLEMIENVQSCYDTKGYVTWLKDGRVYTTSTEQIRTWWKEEFYDKNP